MVIKAPQGHTSIYPCQYLKKNWNSFQQYLTNSGAVSFNAHMNKVLVKDFHDNQSLVKKNRKEIINKINMYDDTPRLVSEKTVPMSDGELLDEINEVSAHRKLLMREAGKRDISL